MNMRNENIGDRTHDGEPGGFEKFLVTRAATFLNDMPVPGEGDGDVGVQDPLKPKEDE